MTADDVQRATTRIAHEIVERNRGVEGLVLVGLQTGGVWLAERLAEVIGGIERRRPGSARAARRRRSTATTSACGRCCPRRPRACRSTSTGGSSCSSTTCSSPGAPCELPSTPSTTTADPKAVQLAVLVDRGHRELPIRPDFVGKNLPTRADETVEVAPDGVAIGVWG